MTVTIPTVNPRRFVRGATVQWYENHADFPPSTWTLSIAFVKADDKQEITATADGSQHLVTIDADASAAFAPGSYRYRIRVVDDSTTPDTVYVLEEGTMVVEEDFFDVESGHDGRSFAARALEAIEAVMEDKASSDQSSFSVGGQQLTRYTWDELNDMRNRFAWEVRREQDRERASQGRPPLTRRQTRFVR